MLAEDAVRPLQVWFLNPEDPAEDLSDTLAFWGRYTSDTVC